MTAYVWAIFGYELLWDSYRPEPRAVIAHVLQSYFIISKTYAAIVHFHIMYLHLTIK